MLCRWTEPSVLPWVRWGSSQLATQTSHLEANDARRPAPLQHGGVTKVHTYDECGISGIMCPVCVLYMASSETQPHVKRRCQCVSIPDPRLTTGQGIQASTVVGLPQPIQRISAEASLKKWPKGFQRRGEEEPVKDYGERSELCAVCSHQQAVIIVAGSASPNDGHPWPQSSLPFLVAMQTSACVMFCQQSCCAVLLLEWAII